MPMTDHDLIVWANRLRYCLERNITPPSMECYKNGPIIHWVIAMEEFNNKIDKQMEDELNGKS